MNLSNRTKYLLLGGLLLLGFYFGSILKPSDPLSVPSPGPKVVFGDMQFDAIIVDTIASRAQGLSGRQDLPSNTGMLFVFQEPGIHGFWMKDMLFAIDMIWIDENDKILHIEKNVDPDTYPTSFKPESEALYVFEINAGISSEIGLQLGQEVEFIR